MLHETTQAHVTHVLLEAVVERSPLDTFDLWTRFEALPRLRRHGLLGDAAAVRSVAGAIPQFAPSALTFVDGPDGYAGTVWIRRLGAATADTDSASAGSSVVVLGVEDPSATRVAARDLARFVEYVLLDGLDRELESVLPCACRGLIASRTGSVEPGTICGLPRSRDGHREG